MFSHHMKSLFFLPDTKYAIIALDLEVIKKLRAELIELGRDPDKELDAYIENILKNHLNRPFYAPDFKAKVEKDTRKINNRKSEYYYIPIPRQIAETYKLEGREVKVWIVPTSKG